MWPAPEPGDIVWCRFPERPRDKPGPKPRPALVLAVTQRSGGFEVEVAYGTSQAWGVYTLVNLRFASGTTQRRTRWRDFPTTPSSTGKVAIAAMGRRVL